MKVILPVNLKMVITTSTKAKLNNEIEKSIRQLQVEIDQLQFQQKKLIADAKKKGQESAKIITERISIEQKTRKDKIELLLLKQEQIEKLTYGDEILYDTVQAEIDVEVGMSWDKLAKLREIIIKDGTVIEIRDVENK